MNENAFKQRTKGLALRSVKMVESVLQQHSKYQDPKFDIARIMGKQLLRSATSVGANYRAVCRAKSNADMVNKLRIVEEEADESIYWIELMAESGLIKPELVSELAGGFDEIVAMVVASQKTLRSNNPKSKIANPK